MGFTVHNRSSDHRFEVRDDETILDAAIREGMILPYSCRNGTCATCKADLVEGRVDYGSYDKAALPDAEREAGRVLLCQAVPLEDVVIDAQEVAAVQGIEIRMLPCRVVGLQRLAHDVMEVQLRLPQNQRLQFLAGQYIDILLRNGGRRSFSLANPPHDDEVLRLHVRRVPDGRFTGHVFDGMKERDLLRLQGPLGTFFLRDSDRPVVLVAGGTGFSPVKSIVEDAIRRGVRRPMHLFWGVRARRDLYMDDLALSWEAEHADFRYTPVLSEPQREDDWQGETGWVHDAVVRHYPDLSGYEVYASGPPPMIEAVRTTFPAHGLPADQLFYDSFEFASERGD